MGHSVQIVGEKSEIINDASLEILLCLFLRELRNEKYSNLEVFRNQWEKALHSSGPGCIDLGTEQFEDSEQLRTEFILMLKEIRKQIADFGESIPMSFLNDLPLPSDVSYSGDSPTKHVHQALDQLERLL